MEPDSLTKQCQSLKSTILAVLQKKELPDTYYDQNSLTEGTKIEHEHFPCDDLAKLIAKDHLNEDPDYYQKLKLMEHK